MNWRRGFPTYSGAPCQIETLVRLADERKLRDPAVLAAQVRRMIQDPKAWMFRMAGRQPTQRREQLLQRGDALHTGPDATVIAHSSQECLLLRPRSSARAFHLQRE